MEKIPKLKAKIKLEIYYLKNTITEVSIKSSKSKQGKDEHPQEKVGKVHELRSQKRKIQMKQ